MLAFLVSIQRGEYYCISHAAISHLSSCGLFLSIMVVVVKVHCVGFFFS